MMIVISAGRAIGSTTDQKIRNVPAPSMRACSSTDTGIDSKKFFMMKTPAASTSSGRIMPGVRVVDAELVEHEEPRDEQHDAGHRHDRDDRGEDEAAPAELQPREGVAGERHEEDTAAA